VFAQQNYYQTAIGLSGEALKTALHNIIDDHIVYPYSSSTEIDTWDIIKEADRDTLNPDNVILIYLGTSVNAAQEFNNGSGWNREHVWPQSRGPFNTFNNPEGTDVHHLRAANPDLNSSRGNKNFDFCSNCGGGLGGNYWNNSTEIFQPRSLIRGDVARMVFYMAVRYEGDNGEFDLEISNQNPATGLALLGNLSALLAWHEADPVIDWERDRNDIVYSYQLNRNPFIDFPELVSHIWGSNVNTPWFPVTTSINNVLVEPNALAISLFPNPASTHIVVKTASDNFQYQILDVTGKLVQSGISENGSAINTEKLSKGLYILIATTQNNSGYSKFIIK